MELSELLKLFKQKLKNGSSDLVTRASGQVIRRRIERGKLRKKKMEW